MVLVQIRPMKTTLINLAALIFSCVVLPAATYLPTSLPQKVIGADCICVGRVASLKGYQSEEDGQIYTRAIIETIDELKGDFPSHFKLAYRGGRLGRIGVYNSHSPNLVHGETRIFFLNVDSDGTLYSPQGEATAVKIRPGGFNSYDGLNVDKNTYKFLTNVKAIVNFLQLAGADVTSQAVEKPSSVVTPSQVTDDGLSQTGIPVAVELFALSSVNLGNYGLGFGFDGDGSTGRILLFPAVALNAEDFVHISVGSATFGNFFGFPPNVTSDGLKITGNDAVELYENSSVVDVFGDVDVDGTGQPWEYVRGWAYRLDSTGPDGNTFNQSNWTFSGVNNYDMEATNADSSNPFPIQTYNGSGSGLVITGILEGPRYASRWLLADRGLPIGVHVDKSTRPAGWTDEQVLGALNNAFEAWRSAVGNTLSFLILDDSATFAQSANNFVEDDEILRIQMHDNFDEINSSGPFTTLGIGGGAVFRRKPGRARM